MRTIYLTIQDRLPVAAMTVNWCARSLVPNPDVAFVIYTDHEQAVRPLVPRGLEHRVRVFSSFYDGADDTIIRAIDFLEKHPGNGSLPHAYVDYFRGVAKELGIMSGFRIIEDTLLDLEPRPINRPYRVLFVNNLVRPEQWNWDNPALLSVLKSVQDRGYNVIATDKNPVCPWTDAYTLADIGWLATQVDYVIGVNADPMCFTFNTRALSRVRDWFVLDKWFRYSYNGRCHNARNLSELVKLLRLHTLI